jgi:putative ABC transport system substrate-binding protein
VKKVNSIPRHQQPRSVEPKRTWLATRTSCLSFSLADFSATQAQFPFLDFIYTSTYPGVGEAMRRREFITFVGGAASWPLAALAQQSERIRHIGVLMAFPENDPEAQSWAAGFREELGKLGWTEGRNVQFDTHWATADVESLQRSAKQLVALQPDLILTGSTPATAAMRQQTNTIPIVFAMVGDPVGSRFVASLLRPGGNLTGFVPIENSLGSKWVELLKEVAPHIVRVALVFDPAMEPFTSYYLDPFKAAAASLGMEATVAPVYDMTSLERVVATWAREPNSGLIVMPDAFTIGHHEDITSSVARYRVPTVYPFRIFAEVRGLVSYGAHSMSFGAQRPMLIASSRVRNRASCPSRRQ